jgi:peptide/nickel transport system ATP-binding protein
MRRGAHALKMLEVVRIPYARRRLDSYPHELSDGMRQRGTIALTLACKPKVLLADEPTTTLDATVQIQILLLLRDLQREFGMSVIFVTHDIGVAVEICNRVAVIYADQIVEQGKLRDVVRAGPPLRAWRCSPRPSMAPSKESGCRPSPARHPRSTRRRTIAPFAPRCSVAQARCSQALPPNVRIGADRLARCILAAIDCGRGVTVDGLNAEAPCFPIVTAGHSG